MWERNGERKKRSLPRIIPHFYGAVIVCKKTGEITSKVLGTKAQKRYH
jgi:hypothetical protein